MTIQNSFNNVLFFGVGGLKLRDLGGNEAAGDVFYLNSNKELIRLGIGSSGQAIVSNGTLPSWGSPSPAGNAGGSLSGSYPNPSLADDAVTFAKMQNIASGVFLGRTTAGTGDPETIAPADARTLLGLGTTAVVNTGTAAGNIPVLLTGGVFPSSVIPPLRSHEFVEVANQAARLALTAAQVQPGDEAYQTDVSGTYKLIAADPSLDASWRLISALNINASSIVAGTIAPARLGSGTPSGSTYLRGDGSWGTVAIGSTPRVNVTATSQQMATNTVYYANNASKVTFTLPATSAVGDRMEVWGVGAGGWVIAQNAGQQIRWLNSITTAGVTGKVDTQLPSVGVVTPQATAILECIIANSAWHMMANGTLDVA